MPDSNIYNKRKGLWNYLTSEGINIVGKQRVTLQVAYRRYQSFIRAEARLKCYVDWTGFHRTAAYA